MSTGRTELDQEWDEPTTLSLEDQRREGMITQDRLEDEMDEEILAEQGDGPDGNS